MTTADPRDFVRLAHCPDCRYDLTGATSAARCPECGRDHDDLAFALPVVNRRLGRRQRRLMMVASCGPVVLALVLYGAGVLSIAAVVPVLIVSALLLTAAISAWRRYHLLRGGADAVILFCSDGVWEQSPDGRVPLPGWSRFRRFRLRRLWRRWWLLSLHKPWWSLPTPRGTRVMMRFRATRREAALVRRRLRRLLDAGAFRSSP